MAMKPGNLSQTVWRRSVGKQFHDQKRDGVSDLTREGRYSSLAMPAGGYAVWADSVKEGSSGRIGYYAVLEAAGNVAAAGAVPSAISAQIQLPPGSEEETLRELAAGIRTACDEMNLAVSCIQGEVSYGVRRNTVLATAAGSAESMTEDRVYPGQEILLCGCTGLEGTLRILDEAEDELRTRFVPAFLAEAKAMTRELVLPQTLAKALELTCSDSEGGQRRCVTAVRQIGSGGILAALWDLAERAQIGLEADMGLMTLRQETVEICEFFHLNPYQMTSAGSFLLAADHAEEVTAVLKEAGARAGRLGVARAQNARVITSGEEVRYLDRPAPDELMRWQGMRPVQR